MSCELTDQKTCSTFPGSFRTNAIGCRDCEAEATAKNAKDTKKGAGWSASLEDIWLHLASWLGFPFLLEFLAPLAVRMNLAGYR
jgi:hypothetical protein